MTSSSSPDFAVPLLLAIIPDLFIVAAEKSPKALTKSV